MAGRGLTGLTGPARLSWWEEFHRGAVAQGDDPFLAGCRCLDCSGERRGVALAVHDPTLETVREPYGPDRPRRIYTLGNWMNS